MSEGKMDMNVNAGIKIDKEFIIIDLIKPKVYRSVR